MGRDRGALAACDHGHRLDRVILLLHRAGPWSAPRPQPGHRAPMARNGRCMAAGSTTSRNTWWRPSAMPDHLVWFKWESYATWLSGFAMLVLVYYLGAELFLIDPTVMELPVWQAVGDLARVAGLRLGGLQHAVQGLRERGPDAADGGAVRRAGGDGLVLHPGLFSGRAALLHLGAFTATIMSANVFFIIMPNQRDRGGRPEGGPQAGPEVRQDRQAAQHAQQLPDAAGASS